jgi:hypothetical protein
MSQYRKKLPMKELWMRIAAITAVVGAVVGTGIYFFQSKSTLKETKANRDTTTLCLPQVSGTIQVLVDRTDALNEQQLQSLSAVFQSIKQSIRKDQRLSVYPIDAETRGVPSTLIDLCAPVTERDASALTENTRRIKNQFNKEFAEPVAVLLEKLKAQKTEVQSPILETLQEVSTIERKMEKGSLRKFILFSDLLQHSQRASLYSAKSSAEAQNLVNSAPVRALMSSANLEGADITIYMVERCGFGEQQKAAKEFWQTLLRKAQPQSLQFETMPTAQNPCPSGKAVVQKPMAPMPPPVLVAPLPKLPQNSAAPQRAPAPVNSPKPPPAPKPVTPAVQSTPSPAPASPVQAPVPPPPVVAAPVATPPPLGRPSDACGTRVLLAREKCIREQCAANPLFANDSQCKRREPRTDLPSSNN